jgi:hypothetical protein
MADTGQSDSGPRPDDPRFLAAIDLIRRTGARSFSIRYSDDEQPVLWMAVGEWRWEDGRPVAEGGQLRYETAAAMDPLTAVMRLLDQTMDGGTCVHCGKVTAVSDKWDLPTFMDDQLCWYVYDPELRTFRRSCEGEATTGA